MYEYTLEYIKINQMIVIMLKEKFQCDVKHRFDERAAENTELLQLAI